MSKQSRHLQVPINTRSNSDTPTSGIPTFSRRDAYGFDKYKWDNGLELQVYDDGRVKIGRWDKAMANVEVRQYAPGGSQGSSYFRCLFTDEFPARRGGD